MFRMARTCNLLAMAAMALLCALPGTAQALELSDKLFLTLSAEADIRFIVEDDRGATKGDGYRFSTNQNEMGMGFEFQPGPESVGKVSGRFVFYGLNDVKSVMDTTDHDAMDPWHFELDEAFIEIRNFFSKDNMVDLRIGRWVNTWGSCDVFNQVDQINKRDESDPVKYDRKLPANMIKGSVYPHPAVEISAIFVPIFEPARLPESAAAALTNTLTPPLKSRDDVMALSALSSLVDINDLNVTTRMLMPKLTWANTQVGVRSLFHLGPVDTALTYYRGRFGYPQPVAINATDPSNIEATLYYPRFQMVGLDANASFEELWDIGWFAEVAVFFPEEVIFAMQLPPGLLEKDVFASKNIDDPFVKASAGFDYTFNQYVFVNFQYVYGFFDEFGDILGLRHYIVPNIDFHALDGNFLIRLSTMLCVSDLSANFCPLVSYIPAEGVELTVGATVFLGETKQHDPYKYRSYDKFGELAVGRSVAYLRAKISI